MEILILVSVISLLLAIFSKKKMIKMISIVVFAISTTFYMSLYFFADKINF
jgi:hypothetical protein